MNVARTLVVVATAAVLTSCAQEVEFGKPKPSASRIELPGGSGPVQPEEWPDACAFLTDTEIAALLPSHQGIERTPSPVQVFDLNVDFVNPREDFGGEAKRGSCDYKVSHGADEYVTISITIEAVADPATVRANYESERTSAIENKTEYGIVKTVDGTGASGCFSSGTAIYSTLNCHKGRLAFEVETLGYASIEGVPDDDFDEVLADRLQPLVVRTLVAKLP